jgi:hypothetical protein
LLNSISHRDDIAVRPSAFPSFSWGTRNFAT